MTITFELEPFDIKFPIKNLDRGSITIGLVPALSFRGAPLGKKGGYGLTNDGRIVSTGMPTGTEWPPSKSWGDIGDVVGCGYISETRSIFFTQAGKYCGIAFTEIMDVSRY
jgi:hypothetical protein